VFRDSEERSASPSRARKFADLHDMPEWLIVTVTYIFRTAERSDEIGEYARSIVKQIEAGKIGAPKGNNLIREFAAQNPRFRSLHVQRQAMQTLLERLRDDAELAKNVRNLNEGLTDEEIAAFVKNIAKHMRDIAQMKGRFMELQKRRKEAQTLE
jgi:hypothetical protein